MPVVPRHNIAATYGTTWERTITLRTSDGQPLDLTGYNALMQIRPSADSAVNLVEATTDNGMIALGDTDGTMTVTLDLEQLDIPEGIYAYGLALIDPLDRLRESVLEGTFSIRKGIPSR